MGGSGGGSYESSRPVGQLRSEVQRELQQAQLDSDVNSLLASELGSINDRDVDLIGERLDEIVVALGDKLAEVDRLLFGGSVAKHTYVDGLSDVDSLVVLNRSVLTEDTPEGLRTAMERALRQGLDMDKVSEIITGFAVTIRYNDGAEIQLLPAVERGGHIAISDKQGSGWSFIRPKVFEERLTAANREQGGRLVPTIKLAKAIVDARVAEGDRPGGYHMEALAIEAFKGYAGPRNNKAMLTRFFERAAERIRHPIADATGQSQRIDEVFGAANSASRQQASKALGRLAETMRSAKTVAEWRRLFE